MSTSFTGSFLAPRPALEPGTYGLAVCSQSSQGSGAPNATCQRSKRVFMTSVTKRYICAGFAAAKIDFFRLWGTVLDRRKRTSLVSAIAKWLGLTLATRAPPVVLALLNVDCKWCLGRAHWICHEWSFGSEKEFAERVCIQQVTALNSTNHRRNNNKNISSYP
jgi:hypothetical protein